MTEEAAAATIGEGTGRPASPALLTLLFTDIVGSTEHVARLGDRDWSALLELHDGTVAQHVDAHSGRVMKKVGDGVFAAFDSPGPAIRCAGAVCDAVRPLGLELRAGVHSGECEIVGDDLVGMAVHIAHRITTLAGPGEVLVSGTVRDLVAGSELDLVDQGARTLKGVPGLWRVFALGGLRPRDPSIEGEATIIEERVAALPGPAPLVGRERELERLERSLVDASAGHGSIQLLAGDPGVGKTSLADALSLSARERGVLVLWGRCWEGGGAPAFWPWVQVVRDYVREEGGEGLMRRLGPAARPLAQLVPELADARSEALPTPPGESEEARFAFFDSTTSFLRDASRARPLLLVLEDLHGADEPSLLLLDFLARELPAARVLVLGTYRPGEVRRQNRGLLRRLVPSAQPTTLAGLGERAAADFIEDRTSKAPSPALVQAIHAGTDGNPFFMEEVIRLLLEQGLLERPEAVSADRLPLPEGVREVVRRRLEPLPDAAGRMLQVCAVLGRAFTLPALERVSGVAREELLVLLDEAALRGLLTEVVGELGRYRFVHTIIREVLYEDLGASARIDLHRRAAEGLEALYAQDPEPRVAELAHHFLEAAPAGDVEKAVDYATRAGDRAMRLLAFEEAAGRYERALQALHLDGALDQEVRCDLLVALGEAVRRSGDPAKAKEAFRDAADLARRIGATQGEARAALGFAGRYWTTGVVDEEVVGMLERALSVLGPGETPLKAEVLGRLATELYYSATPERSDSLSREALGIARRTGEPRTLASVLDARLGAAWRPDNLEERLELATEIVDLADRARDRETAVRGRTFRVSCLLELGDVVAADAEIETATRLAEELHQPRFIWHTLGLRALRALMSGSLDDAERLAEDALAAGRRADPQNADHYHAIQLATLRYGQGRLEEIEAPMRSFVERFPNLGTWRCTLALLYSELGREADARRELERASAGDWAALRRDSTWCVGIARAADACAQLGDSGRAERLYELLLPFESRNLVLGRVASISIGSAARYLGMLAATMSRFDGAAGHFERALASNSAMGARPWLVHTRCDYARMLLTRREGDDRRRATWLLDEAEAEAGDIGMERIVERAGSLRAAVGDQPTGARDS